MPPRPGPCQASWPRDCGACSGLPTLLASPRSRAACICSLLASPRERGRRRAGREETKRGRGTRGECVRMHARIRATLSPFPSFHLPRMLPARIPSREADLPESRRRMCWCYLPPHLPTRGETKDGRYSRAGSRSDSPRYWEFVFRISVHSSKERARR